MTQAEIMKEVLLTALARAQEDTEHYSAAGATEMKYFCEGQASGFKIALQTMRDLGLLTEVQA